MIIKRESTRKLVELREVNVGEMFLYNSKANSDMLFLFLKTSNQNDCHEVGGDREFNFANSTAVYPVKTLTVEY